MPRKKLSGISYRKDRDVWYARIMFNKKSEYIGSFRTPEEATEAYRKRSQELYGFDRVDFGEETGNIRERAR